jgi:pyridoxine kinase
MAQPAVLLVSDLPVWGRVALASAVPLLEAAGFQACSLPTALLSTHGAYPGFVIEPQTAYLQRAWNHLSSLDLKFAAIAVGFVARPEQFELIETMVSQVKAAGGLVLVDPVLGDNGHRYGLLSEGHIGAFQSLVRLADVITPNLTEAALLVGEDPQNTPDELTTQKWLGQLAALGPQQVVVTSAPFGADWAGRPQTGFQWLDGASEGRLAHRQWGPPVPGTGDAFAARLLASLLEGRPLADAVKLAARATLADLRRTKASQRPALWGLEGPLSR